MIECGLGVVVICLPSLRPLYKAFPLHTIVSGVRSMLLKRRWSQESGDIGLYNVGRSANSAYLDSNFDYHKYDGSRNTYAVGAHCSYDGPRSGIQVKHEIEQY
jgi:hypothetical protein